MPEFPGGDEALFKFIAHNVMYPDYERENDIQGRVVLSFIIDTNGAISNIEVKKSASKGLDAEAIRVVKLLPKFKPGKQQGKPVRVTYVLPIMFKLSGDATPAAASDTVPHPLPVASNKSNNDFIMPEFPGGNTALTNYINDHNKYLKKRSSGKHKFVLVMVTIDTKGKVTNTKVINGVSEEFNKEAIRLTSKLPLFQPALTSGKPTTWYYLIPVLFVE